VVLLVDASTVREHLDAQLSAAGTAPARVELARADGASFDLAFAALRRAAG
jgi:hypothetical protein